MAKNLRDSLKNTAASYLKDHEHSIEQQDNEEIPTSKKVTRGPIIEAIEPRTKRKQFTFSPSVHDRAVEKCKRMNLSMNEVVNQLLTYWVNEEE